MSSLRFPGMRPFCLLLFGLALAVGGAYARAAAPAPEPLRVMSFNVRYAAPGDGINVWENRRDLTAATILRRRPAIIGTQELLLSQARDLQSRLVGYAWFGKGRNGNEIDQDDNEHMGVFYDTKHLKLLDHGDFWYSETPDVPGSPNFGQSMPRMATWGQFEVRSSGRRFFFLDTHFPYRAEAESVRERCARLLLERIGRLAQGLPVIVTGDFNSGPETATHKLLTAQLADVREAAPVRLGPELTVHGFTGVPTKRIDWVLVRGFKVDKVETATDHDGAIYPSDHFPVIADLAW